MKIVILISAPYKFHYYYYYYYYYHYYYYHQHLFIQDVSSYLYSSLE